MKNSKQNNINSPILDETLPHQAHFPSFKGTEMKMQEPFINAHGVIIGDSQYNSPDSPLNNWSDEIDPATMAGDEWIHPTNDIGWTTPENQELLEEKKETHSKTFMHPQYGIND
ncbi:DUF3905 domain-containing protein [Bacillus sp. 165]|uniref:DUF3905 domain-containing protein n=1 Tax=Bacillus sp. 165 TaxID=1529117 RepID=UPI001ADA2523|nr:DUF3905 domain-containing protein [Bacillus sp. 165]MBO9128455.1 DUF3905 domain-containing protein [Bacillus sp. 165]